MSVLIILTAQQAASVTGPSKTNPQASCAPVPLADGTFALPVEMLKDPDHASIAGFLGALPQVDAVWGDAKQVAPSFDRASRATAVQAEVAAAQATVDAQAITPKLPDVVVPVDGVADAVVEVKP